MLQLAIITPFFILFISTRHTCDAMVHVVLLTGLPGSTLVNALKQESTVTATRCNSAAPIFLRMPFSLSVRAGH